MNTIPELSIVFLAISTVINIGLPIALFFLWRKKYGLKLVPLIVGVAAYIIFVMVLEQPLYSMVLHPTVDVTIDLVTIDLLKYSPLLFVLYTIFSAAIIEETARFLSFQLLKKKFRGIGTGLSYGIGFGGIRTILFTSKSMLGLISLNVMINSGIATMLNDSPALVAQINSLIAQTPAMFLVSGIESIIIVYTLNISLSIIVWRSVNAKGRLWLYPAAIVLGALANTPSAMSQAGVIHNGFVANGAALVILVLIAIIAYKICKAVKRESEEESLLIGDSV